jgi:hypothetical protein
LGVLFVKNYLQLLLALPALCAAPPTTFANDAPRVAVVRERGADVMPFDLSATTHVFTKTPVGGVQTVVAKSRNDERQIGLIRGHLNEIADRFGHGDFSAPTHVHGTAMPGLDALKSAPAGALKTRYRDVESGAEVSYSSNDPKIVAALHEWFDAQLADHGPDPAEGHQHSMPPRP